MPCSAAPPDSSAAFVYVPGFEGSPTSRFSPLPLLGLLYPTLVHFTLSFHSFSLS